MNQKGRTSFKKLVKQVIRLRKNKDPYLLKRILLLLYCDVLRLLTRPFKPTGIRVEDEKWDYLIILDACRYDVFEKVYRDYFKEGTLTKKISQAVETKSWLNNNFKKKTDDIIYISANPFVNKNKIEQMPWNACFYDIIEVWKQGWDKSLEAAHPKTVVEHALNARKKYPDKKLVIHFIQPHVPFIGDFRIDIARPRSILNDMGYKKVAIMMDEVKFGKNVSLEDVRKAYESNLRLALQEIQKLLPHLEGRVIISADHGELLGEWGLMFHPIVYTKKLLEIPWLVIDKEKKKEKGKINQALCEIKVI